MTFVEKAKTKLQEMKGELAKRRDEILKNKYHTKQLILALEYVLHEKQRQVSEYDKELAQLETELSEV